MDQTTQNYVTQAQNAYSDPAIGTAQTSATNAQSAAGNSQAADISLPSLLKQAIDSKFYTDQNPEITNLNSDQTAFQNASDNVKKSVLPENNGGIVLSPQDIMQRLNSTRNLYAGKVGLDQMLLTGSTGGLANMMDVVAKTHATQTQQLISAADVAQKKYQTLLDQVQQKSSVAMNAANLAQQAKQLGISQQQVDLQKQEFQKSADYNRPLVLVSMQQDAKQGMTWGDMLKKYGNNPYINSQEILNTYNQANYYKRPAGVSDQQKNSFNLNLGTGTVPQGITSLLGGNSASAGSSASQADPLGIR